MAGRNLHADTGLSLRHHGIVEAGHEDTLVLQTGGEILRQFGIVEHHGADSRLRRLDVEAGGHHTLAEMLDVLHELVVQRIALAEHLGHYQINLPLWMRLQKEDEIQPMLNQLKNRYRQWQYRRICRTLQLPPQLIQDLPTLANQTQQSGAAVQQLQTTMQQTLSRLQQDDLTTLSLLERVTKLERAASSQGSHNMDLNMLMKTTYSQSGEDAILAYLFAVLGIPFAKCTYLDLGANRPKEMSNTYFFYEQGATGTLIEANPALIPALQKERSGDVILNRCIAPKSGDVIPFHVMNVDGLSTPEDVTELLANHPDLKLLETVNVETVSVNDLFAQMHAVPVFVRIHLQVRLSHWLQEMTSTTKLRNTLSSNFILNNYMLPSVRGYIYMFFREISELRLLRSHL